MGMIHCCKRVVSCVFQPTFCLIDRTQILIQLLELSTLIKIRASFSPIWQPIQSNLATGNVLIWQPLDFWVGQSQREGMSSLGIGPDRRNVLSLFLSFSLSLSFSLQCWVQECSESGKDSWNAALHLPFSPLSPSLSPFSLPPLTSLSLSLSLCPSESVFLWMALYLITMVTILPNCDTYLKGLVTTPIRCTHP